MGDIDEAATIWKKKSRARVAHWGSEQVEHLSLSFEVRHSCCMGTHTSGLPWASGTSNHTQW